MVANNFFLQQFFCNKSVRGYLVFPYLRAGHRRIKFRQGRQRSLRKTWGNLFGSISGTNLRYVGARIFNVKVLLTAHVRVDQDGVELGSDIREKR